MKTSRRFVIGLLAGTLAVIGCSNGNGDTDCAPPTADVTGTWNVNFNAMSSISGCPAAGSYVATGTQAGSDVTFMDPSGGTYSAVMCGNIVTASEYSYPYDGGTTTISDESLTVTGSNSLTGTYTWSWTDGADVCGGTGTLTGVR